jgi:pyridinium-3,5-bisthiocarboxylic acid mononucleotide nickel chelatase
MSMMLHIDPFGGAAGDMLLGALLDLGVDRHRLEGILAGLHLTGWRLEADRTRHQGLAGVRVRVVVDDESHPARHLADVERMLTEASLPHLTRERALATFRRLFEAEASVHGVQVAEAHLHELAAVDAVIDIVGVCAAVELLDVSRVTCAPVPVGRGTVQTEHGLLPVPPPAVAALLAGVPLAGYDAEGEMTTPTGAALLRTLVDAFEARLAGRALKVGTGLGTRRFEGLPNVLRAMLLDAGESIADGRRLDIVECTLDDVTGETIAYMIDRLLRAGARDAWCLPGTGRKGRPVHELRVLADPGTSGDIVRLLFLDGATLGARVVPCLRPELARRSVAVDTPYGPIPVKLGVLDGVVVSAKPEHEACLSAAERSGVSLTAVVSAARAAGPAPGSKIGN